MLCYVYTYVRYQSVKVGDQILEVNGISFIRILHAEAAKILK